MRGEYSHVISETERGKGFGLLAGSPTSLSGGYRSPFALWKLMNLCALFFFFNVALSFFGAALFEI